MSDDTDQTIEESEESDEQDTPTTITLDIPVDEIHQSLYEQLSADPRVDQLLAQNLQPSAESLLHDLYQNEKYENN